MRRVRLGQDRGREWVVLAGVGDAEAAPEDELGQLDAVLVADLGVQADDAPHGDLEAAEVEDLRADVHVQTTQIERRQQQDPCGRLPRRRRRRVRSRTSGPRAPWR